MNSKLKIYYNSKQSNVITNTPSSQKAELLIQDINKGFFKDKVEIVSEFNVVSSEILALAHQSLYVHNILSLKKSSGYNMRSQEINELLKYNVSSFLEASIYAYENKRE